MSRQSRDPLVSSSIALLQERFRQLQRAKEMREKRELSRQLTESQHVHSITCYDPSRLFFQSELILPPRQPLQGSPSIQHNCQSKHADLKAVDTPPSANLLHTERVMYRSSSFDDSDIDTSLHL